MISIVVSLMMIIAKIIVILTISGIVVMTGKGRRVAIKVVSFVSSRTMIGIPIIGAKIIVIIFVNSRKVVVGSFRWNGVGLVIVMRHRIMVRVI